MAKYNNGDEFKIKIESSYVGGGCLDKDGNKEDPIDVYRVSGIILEESDLDKLEKIDSKKMYTQEDMDKVEANAFNEVWESLSDFFLGKVSHPKIHKVFGLNNPKNVFLKCKSYEEFRELFEKAKRLKTSDKQIVTEFDETADRVDREFKELYESIFGITNSVNNLSKQINKLQQSEE